ncbi:Cobalamin (vitamin B12)-binding domain [Moorella glycerini]|uniref:Methylaspartate mutase S chain n=1 Tax=Neomoorella stamsii TaxID=1266720 RepID=A0A9X7J3R3_9FIRM|nr:MULTISPECIES: cobalamin-dependent protein [Moorella]PRR74353.1 Methylaspartate mutase S chain [Moorella stamsii]CEP66760.1 Cobalamin (vitamin B12)-binding domain [Moorella glycerini]
MINHLQDLAQAVKDGDNKKARSLTRQLLAEGIPIDLLVEKGLTEPLNSLNSKCTIDDFSLLEIFLAGRAMMDVLEVISNSGQKVVRPLPEMTVILGTIKDDLHDLGKHIVSIFFSLAGLKVIDLGKDVEPQKFVQAAIEYKADCIAVSSLLTITAQYAKEIRRLATHCGLNDITIIAGGAGFRLASRKYLGVDFVARDVFAGLDYLLSLGRRKKNYDQTS